MTEWSPDLFMKLVGETTGKENGSICMHMTECSSHCCEPKLNPDGSVAEHDTKGYPIRICEAPENRCLYMQSERTRQFWMIMGILLLFGIFVYGLNTYNK